MDEREADINSSVYIIVFSLIVCLTFTVWQWWSYSAKKKKIEKKAGLQPLLPPLPKHNIQQRQEVVKSIRLKFTSIRDRCPSHDSVLSVYLEGPPAFGKTQAARQFAKEYYRMNAQKRDVVVGTLNASTRSELLDSYVQLAAHLGLKININQIPPDERLNRGLQFVSNTVRNLLKSKDEWLLIVDNLTSEVKQMDYDDVERIDSSRILPQSGCEDWGYGYVLITTKEGSLVEKGGSVFSDYYYLDHGFSEEEGIKFLTSTCGINNDDELSDAKKLIKNLEGIPLSVAAAGCYIVKERSYRRNYSFSKYLKDLDKTHRDFAEQQTKQINNYPWTLTTALLMCILQQRPLYKVFCFLSSCAHAPMPMRLIARVLKEDLEVVTPAIQEVRDSVLLQIAYWSTTNDDDPIPVVQTHEVTWNVMRNLYYQNLDINRSHENIGQQIPTIAELNSIQIVDWFSLGLKLGINEYELNVMQTNDPKDNKACKRTMFSMWLRTDLKATFRKLIFALEEIGEVKVSKDLRKQNGLSRDNVTFIYSWSEMKQLLSEFANCLIIETSSLDEIPVSPSPLYDYQHRLLPHIESLVTIKDFDTLFSPDLQFQLRYYVGRQYLITAQRQKAKRLLEDALSMIESCSDAVKRSIIHQRAKLHLGVVNSHLGRPNVATTLYDELLITLTDTYGDDSHYVAKALHLIGGSLTPHQKYDKSEEYLKRALSIMEKVHGPDHPEIATILCSLGENMINNSAKTNDSVKTLNRAVSILEPLQRHRRELASTLAMLGAAYCYANKPQEAAHTFQRCLDIYQNLFGKNNIYNGVAYSGLCVSHHLMGCIVESKEYSELATEIFDTYPDVSCYRVAALRYQHLAATHCIQGDYTKTNLLLVRADGIIREIKDNQLHMYSRFLTSCNCILNGNFKEAIQGTEIPREQFTEAHSVIVSTYGIVCLEMGDVSKLIAVQNALKSRPLLKKLLASMLTLVNYPTQPYKIPTIHILATLVNTYLSRNHISWPPFNAALKGIFLLQQGKHEEAECYLQSAVDQYTKMFAQRSLLAVEAKLYLATCVLQRDEQKALDILSKAQVELESFSCNCHPLSAKLSYLTSLIYYKLKNLKLAQFHITATLEKVQSYCSEIHPWVAELHFQLVSFTNCSEQKLKVKGIYEKLIERETAMSRLLDVEEDCDKVIKLWQSQIDKLIAES